MINSVAVPHAEHATGRSHAPTEKDAADDFSLAELVFLVPVWCSCLSSS